MINLNINKIQAIRNNIERGDGLNPFVVQILAIGGGGNGEYGTGAAGGGAGAFISSSWLIPAETTFDIEIGNPGSGSLNSATKLILTSTSDELFVAPGGGNAVGQDGGSGGGGATGGPTTGGGTVEVTIPYGAILALEPTGYAGGNITGGNPGTTGGAGGGGVLGVGSDRFDNTAGVAGGPGINIANTIVNGLVSGITTLAFGGEGRCATCGGGNSAPANSGGGGQGNGGGAGSGGIGGSGLFAIKYAGLPKATGGTITQSGGYTTHVFTTSGQLTTTGKTNNNP